MAHRWNPASAGLLQPNPSSRRPWEGSGLCRPCGVLPDRSNPQVFPILLHHWLAFGVCIHFCLTPQKSVSWPGTCSKICQPCAANLRSAEGWDARDAPAAEERSPFGRNPFQPEVCRFSSIQSVSSTFCFVLVAQQCSSRDLSLSLTDSR